MNFMDIYDEIVGRFEIIGELWSILATMHKGTVRRWYGRADKYKGKTNPQPTGREINAHLARYGVKSYMMGFFDSKKLSYTHRKTQKRWHDFLVREVADKNSPTGKRIVLHHPKRAWADGPKPPKGPSLRQRIAQALD